MKERKMSILLILLASLVIFAGLFFSVFGFMVVRNGTATAFETLGRFSYLAIELAGYCFDANDYIIVGQGRKSMGDGGMIRIFGLVFYIRGLMKPILYRDKSEDDGFGSGYSVFLNQMQEELVLAKAETASPENVALDIKYVVKWRIANPYLYLYMAPKDAKKQIINKLHAVVRAWVKSGTENHAQSAKGDGVQFWKDLVSIGCEAIFDEVESQWGLEIIKDSIIVTDIGYDADYQEALKAESQVKLQAKAELMKQKIGAMSFAAQTSGTEITMISKWIGIPVKRLQQELRSAIKADSKNGFEKWLKKYPIVRKNWNLIQQKQLGVRPNLFGNADGSPMDPLTTALATLISLAKSSSAGPTGTSPTNPGGKGDKGQGGRQGGRRKNPPSPPAPGML